jgi:hypothetical protein
VPKYTNTFMRPEYHDEMVLGENRKLIGTIRIKPSSVMWEPNGSRRFLSVPLDRFAAWITSAASQATRSTR